MANIKNKTIIVTGASQGIGQAIAAKYAENGANLVILTKDSEERIQQLVVEMSSSEEQVLALDVDVSNFDALKEAVSQAIDRFEAIDGVVNNTSETCFEDIFNLSPKQFDMMIGTSVRAAFFLSQLCLPYLQKASNPHIINISPPLNMDPHWFKTYLGFSISKYAMSMCTLGMAETLAQYKIAVNSLWPKSTIATQTIKDHFSQKVYEGSRHPSIMADAALELILRDASTCTGQFYTDEAILAEAGITDFSDYAVDPHNPLMQALFIPQEENMVPVSQDLFR